jgi:hypothetical protein
MKTTRTATAKTMTKQQRHLQQQHKGVSVVNHAEPIVAEDIVVPGTPSLRSWLPHCGTILSDHVVSWGREVYSLLCRGIHRKSGQNIKKYLDLGPDLDWLACQPVQIWTKSQKVGLVKI